MHMRKISGSASQLLSRVGGAMQSKWRSAAQPCQSGESARILLFGQQARPEVMFMQTPLGAHTLVKVGGGGIFDVLASLLGMGRGAGLGLAPPQNARSRKRRHGIFSTVCHWEFLIPGGKPVQIENVLSAMNCADPIRFAGMQLIFQQRSCASNVASFVAQAGKDYEVGIYRNGGVCTVMVCEVRISGSGTSRFPVAVDY